MKYSPFFNFDFCQMLWVFDYMFVAGDICISCVCVWELLLLLQLIFRYHRVDFLLYGLAGLVIVNQRTTLQLPVQQYY